MPNLPHAAVPAISRRAAIAMLAAAGSSAAAGCSPLGAFSLVAGRDVGGRQAAADVPYGPHPRQRLDVYAPLSASGPAPVVMFFYGGSWNSGRRQDYAFVGHALAARGLVAVIADYRLVPEIRFPAFVEDGAQAARWMHDGIAAHGGDPARIALMGHSAGAYIAAMLALNTRFLRKAGVDPRDVKALVGLAGPYDFLPLTEPITRPTFGSAPDPAQTQPVNFARSGAPPALLATGSADDTVKPRNSQALAARLKAAGSSASVRSYEGVDHAGILLALSRLLRDRAPVLDDVTAFLARHLQREAAAG
jgi:acetyl esterase/lipase